MTLKAEELYREKYTRNAVVQVARSWIGTPYRHQASLKGCGADCLGFVRGVFREICGWEPEATPPYSKDWAETGGREALLEAAHRNLVPIGARSCPKGSILIFRPAQNGAAKHVAIASGVDVMIHAQERYGVTEVSHSAWWRRRLVATFDLPGVARKLSR